MSQPIYTLVETSTPAEEPLSLSSAKDYLRVSHEGDDALIEGLITAARMACEIFTGRAFVTRNCSLYLDRWPESAVSSWWDGMRDGADIKPPRRSLTLPKAPVFSISAIIVHDDAGSSQTYASSNYVADTIGGRIVLKENVAAPETTKAASGIEVQFSAGYGAAASVPVLIVQAMRQMVAFMYEHRETGAEQALRLSGAANLLQPFRVMEIA